MDQSHWTTAKKPWPKEICCQRYVQGSRITLKELALEGKRSQHTLSHWSTQDKWQELRKNYQEEMALVSQRKTIQKASDAIADKTEEVQKEHRATLAQQRRIASTFMNSLAITLKSIQAPGKVPPEEVQKADQVIARVTTLCGRNPLGVCSQIILATATMERAIYNLDLVDPRELEKQAKKYNLLLVDAEELELLGVE